MSPPGSAILKYRESLPAEIISENPDDWNNHYFTVHAYVYHLHYPGLITTYTLSYRFL